MKIVIQDVKVAQVIFGHLRVKKRSNIDASNKKSQTKLENGSEISNKHHTVK